MDWATLVCSITFAWFPEVVAPPLVVVFDPGGTTTSPELVVCPFCMLLLPVCAVSEFAGVLFAPPVRLVACVLIPPGITELPAFCWLLTPPLEPLALLLAPLLFVFNWFVGWNLWIFISLIYTLLQAIELTEKYPVISFSAPSAVPFWTNGKGLPQSMFLKLESMSIFTSNDLLSGIIFNFPLLRYVESWSEGSVDSSKL